MGAALIIKPALNRRFSVITFGIAQVAMDIEPGVRMAAGSEGLHGATHTFLGALIIAILVTLIAPVLCNGFLAKWSKEVISYKMPGLAHSSSVSRSAVILGAFFGTWSHVVLDSLIHHDIHPLSPFSQANPFMGMMAHDVVYQACTIAGVMGIVACLVIQWVGSTRPVKGKQRGI